MMTMEELLALEPGHCPHCRQTLRKYSVSAFTFSDGLGFGTPLLHVCFNDHCPIYVKAWESMASRFGRVASQRYWFNPVDSTDGVLPVGAPHAMRGDIIE